MTSRNSNLNINRIPFLLSPCGRDYLWGGQRLKDGFSKDLPLNPLAETWECSTREDGESIVASGIYKGLGLKKVLEDNPEMLGTNMAPDYKLPILIKFIDAKTNLSVQVHPDDEYAFKNENGSLGKTEMWYVVEASKDAYLIYGFLHDIDKETVRKSLADNTIEKYLRKVPVKKGDIFYIPAGQIHAICKGCLVAEVQENSDITYRLYDYDRIDKNGNKRELHIEKALDVINYKGSNNPRQPMHMMRFRKGVMIENICSSNYFEVEKVTLNTESNKKLAHFKTREDSFRVLMCVEGCGIINFGGGEYLNFFRGDTIFVPANSIEYSVHGKATFLRISC